MKYFTREEASYIIRNSGLGLCVLFNDNPNLEAMIAVRNIIDTDKHCCDPYWAACLGFVLGRATGKREERTRRRTTE